MKNIFVIFKIAIVCLMFVTFSCSSDDSDQNKAKSVSSGDTLSNETSENVSYQIPSPEALFSLIKSLKLPYHENLMSPLGPDYVSVNAKELNLGVYVADLSYCSVFNQNQNTLKYFSAVYKLSEGLGISSIVGGAFLDRLKNNLTSPDSLTFLTNSSYYSIIHDLNNSGKGKTVAVITAGGWIEGLYIVSYLIEKYSDNNSAISKIADQKIVFNNLYKNLEQFKSDPGVVEILKDIEPIKLIFDQMVVETNENSGVQKNKEGKIIIGSKEKYSLSEAQFNDFKTKIKEVRTKITK